MARLPLSPALLVLVALAASAPHAQEVDCEAACRMPILAPDECACDVRIPAGTGGEVADPRAAALLDAMERTYQASIATVSDYTVVQTTDLTPMPVVLHYQKEVFDGTPQFRLVPPSEIAAMQQEARGEHTAEDIGEAVGALADLIGGGAAPDTGADDCTGIACRIASDLNEVAGALRGDQTEASRLSVLDGLFQRADFRRRARVVGQAVIDDVQGEPDSPLAPPGDPPDQAHTCNVLRAEDLQDVDLGEGYDEFELQAMEIWVTADVYGYPLLVQAELLHVPSGQVVKVTETIVSNRVEEPRVAPPHVRHALLGLGAVLDAMGLASDSEGGVYETVTTIHKFIVNGGMPSQEEARQLIQEVLAALGGVE